MKRRPAIPLGMTAKKLERDEDKIPAEYGQKLSDAARALGLNDRDAAKLAGYKPGPKTKDIHLHRLRSGEGSLKAAVKFHRALTAKGAEIPPPPTPGVEPPKPQPWWRETWVQLGEVLHLYMSESKFNELIIDLRNQAQAHELVTRGFARVARPMPWDADSSIEKPDDGAPRRTETVGAKRPSPHPGRGLR